MRFLLADFSSLSKSFVWQHKQPPDVLPLFTGLCFLWASLSISQVTAKQDWTPYQCLGHAASEWPPVELHGSDHNPPEPCQFSHFSVHFPVYLTSLSMLGCVLDGLCLDARRSPKPICCSPPQLVRGEQIKQNACVLR